MWQIFYNFENFSVEFSIKFDPTIEFKWKFDY
jgi:hypothetical protein